MLLMLCCFSVVGARGALWGTVEMRDDHSVLPPLLCVLYIATRAQGGTFQMVQ